MTELNPVTSSIAPEFKCPKCGGKIDAAAKMTRDFETSFASIKMHCFSCHSLLAEWDFDAYV